MSHKLHDAMRHLEKDMLDIMDVLVDKSTTEIILNPYRRANGDYIGYILVEKHGTGVHNLLRYTECTIEPLTVDMGDHILYVQSLEADLKIVFWVKFANGENTLKCISLCLKSYFTSNMICQTDDFELLEFTDMLENGYLLDSPIVLDQPIELLLEQINQHIVKNKRLRLNHAVITSEASDLGFRKYPSKFRETNLVKMSYSKAETIMSVLASISGKFIHQKIPFLECQIPKYGYRFTGVIPPVVPFPSFCIRKHASQIFTLDDFVKQGVLQQSSKDTILNWIRRKFNILIAGGTGSGKTTLANAILHEISAIFPDTRVLIIEDVPELKFNTSRSVGFTVSEFFSMYEALRTTLRFKPERIVMGEIRGKEAYTLLKAWNTGHPGGVATIHANGVDEALYRFESCIRDYPEVKINRQEIGFTINGIISVQNVTVKELVENGGYANVVRRKVTALRQILQYDPDKDIYQDIIYDRENLMD